MCDNKAGLNEGRPAFRHKGPVSVWVKLPESGGMLDRVNPGLLTLPGVTTETSGGENMSFGPVDRASSSFLDTVAVARVALLGIKLSDTWLDLSDDTNTPSSRLSSNTLQVQQTKCGRSSVNAIYCEHRMHFSFNLQVALFSFIPLVRRFF